MQDPPSLLDRDALEVECAHCGDLTEVLVGGADPCECPSCGEPVELPEGSGVNEPIDRRITMKFRKLPRL
jgi:hypothetical protein